MKFDLYQSNRFEKTKNHISLFCCLSTLAVDNMKEDLFNSSPLGRNGRHFVDGILKCIFMTESFVFSFKFPCNLFLRVQLTIRQNWFGWWLGAGQVTSHYLNQCGPSSLTRICGTVEGSFKLHKQYLSCWLPGDARSQGISSQGFDYVFPSYPGFGTKGNEETQWCPE